MKPEMWLKHEPINPKALRDFESTIAHTLPDDYRTFLLETNGGIPVDSTFSFLDSNSSSVLFFGLGVTPRSNDLSYAKAAFSHLISEGYLPIGRDPGGNLVLIGLVGEKKNKIAFWDHEMEAGETGGKFAEIPLAETFSEFLNGLKPEAEE